MTADRPALVYIVTLNWNRCADTLELLESCGRQTYANCRMLVVDNASTDGSPEALAARFPAVEQVRNPRNLGFAGGMNSGMRTALARGAEYIFVANNDTTLAPDCIAQLVSAAQTYNADIVAPAIYYAEPPDRLWSLGGQRRQLTLEIRQCHQDAEHERREEPFAVDFVTGCGMLVHRSCLERVGLFDEHFFMYYEDADFCLRAQRAGARMYIVPRARMWHKVAVSSGGSDSPGERYHMARSSVQFFAKHVRGWRWLIVAPYRAASAARTIVRLLAHRRPRAARAYLRGLLDGVR